VDQLRASLLEESGCHPPSAEKVCFVGHRLPLTIIEDNEVAIHALVVVLGF